MTGFLVVGYGVVLAFFALVILVMAGFSWLESQVMP